MNITMPRVVYQYAVNIGINVIAAVAGGLQRQMGVSLSCIADSLCMRQSLQAGN